MSTSLSRLENLITKSDCSQVDSAQFRSLFRDILEVFNIYICIYIQYICVRVNRFGCFFPAADATKVNNFLDSIKRVELKPKLGWLPTWPGL